MCWGHVTAAGAMLATHRDPWRGLWGTCGWTGRSVSPLLALSCESSPPLTLPACPAAACCPAARAAPAGMTTTAARWWRWRGTPTASSPPAPACPLATPSSPATSPRSCSCEWGRWCMEAIKGGHVSARRCHWQGCWCTPPGCRPASASQLLPACPTLPTHPAATPSA